MILEVRSPCLPTIITARHVESAVDDLVCPLTTAADNSAATICPSIFNQSVPKAGSSCFKRRFRVVVSEGYESGGGEVIAEWVRSNFMPCTSAAAGISIRHNISGIHGTL